MPHISPLCNAVQIQREVWLERSWIWRVLNWKVRHEVGPLGSKFKSDWWSSKIWNWLWKNQWIWNAFIEIGKANRSWKEVYQLRSVIPTQTGTFQLQTFQLQTFEFQTFQLKPFNSTIIPITSILSLKKAFKNTKIEFRNWKIENVRFWPIGIFRKMTDIIFFEFQTSLIW